MPSGHRHGHYCEAANWRKVCYSSVLGLRTRSYHPGSRIQCLGTSDSEAKGRAVFISDDERWGATALGSGLSVLKEVQPRGRAVRHFLGGFHLLVLQGKTEATAKSHGMDPDHICFQNSPLWPLGKGSRFTGRILVTEQRAAAG